MLCNPCGALGQNSKFTYQSFGSDYEGVFGHQSFGSDNSNNGLLYANYRHCFSYDGDLTKYCNDSHVGYQSYTDNLTVLQAEDDAALKAATPQDGCFLFWEFY